MPTAYTQKILEGATFEGFVWTAARAMGAFIMQRDDPSDAPPVLQDEPESYHAERLTEAQEELAAFERMSRQEREGLWQAAKAQWEAQEAESRQADREKRQKYEAILEKVKAWQPPTPEHEGFKQFMVEQITESIRFDCLDRDERFYDSFRAPPFAEWEQQKIESLKEDIAYHKRKYAEEVERTRERNEWKAALLASVPLPSKTAE